MFSNWYCVIFFPASDTTYTVEELIAQMLAYAKDMAMSHTEQRIKDCVITVPPFFNQVERRAMLTAAELAGLKVGESTACSPYIYQNLITNLRYYLSSH